MSSLPILSLITWMPFLGAVLIMLGAFLAYMGIWIALVLAGFSVEGESAVEGESGWLGLSQRC